MSAEGDGNQAGFKKLKIRLEKIGAGPVEAREDLIWALVEDFRETDPGTIKLIAEWGRNGLFLGEALVFALESALGRDDLAEEQKRAALNDAGVSVSALKAFQGARNGLVSRDIAMQLATSALFLGLSSGLRREEIEHLRQRFFRANQSERGQRSAAKQEQARRPWKIKATDLAQGVRAKHPTYSQEPCGHHHQVLAGRS